MGIAIVGMAGRYPGADNLETFWNNLSASRDVRRVLSSTAPPQRVPRGAKAVRAAYVLDGIERFDAAFFDMTPREAALTDPQHRILLECAYEALEDAGHVDERAGTIGVFASANFNSYLYHVAQQVDYADIAKHLEVVIGNDKDYLATRISYKLGLTGPSLCVQTACSSSLVAVCVAAQALRSMECDIALVGGVGVRALQETGYLVRPGEGVCAEDGRTRPFEARGSGFVEGNGVGAVVLRRLEDAQAQRDTIHAVIRGWAVNNDGAAKVAYTSPSVLGQAQVIEEAVAMAEIDPVTVGYIEAHGTGTPVGDPIEVEALGRTYGRRGGARCRLGSVKADIGHLDAAAGVTGLIRAVLCIKNRHQPGILGFERPNPHLRLAELGFEVCGQGQRWQSQGDAPRRAAVSSLGIGGTNAHVVLEEASNEVPEGASRASARGRPVLLTVSGRTRHACEQAAVKLASWLEQNQEASLVDVAHTLRVGRRALSHRRIAVVSDVRDAIQALTDSGRFLEAHLREGQGRQIAFLFPGAGKQYAGMGEALYRHDPTYRQTLDECARWSWELAGVDLQALLSGRAVPPSAWVDREHAGHGFLALFSVGVALARCWIARGVLPSCALGHSLGEYAAAHLAGVFSLRRAIEVLWARGQVFGNVPDGGMLALQLPEAEVLAVLSGSLSLAAVNGPSACVVSGLRHDVDALERHMRARGVSQQRLAVTVAAHNPLLRPHLEEFRACLAKEPLAAPELPWVSCMTGAWIREGEAVDPEYWIRHLWSPVRFSAAVATVLADGVQGVVQLGPGRGLLQQVLAHAAEGQFALAGLPEPARPDGPQEDAQDSYRFGLEAIGRAWLRGTDVDFSTDLWSDAAKRVSLPTYPFERERHWIDRGETPDPGRLQEPSGYVPSWKRLPPRAQDSQSICAPRWWVVGSDQGGWGAALAEALREMGAEFKVLSLAGEVDGVRESELADALACGRPDIVVYLGGLRTAPASDVVHAGVEHSLEGNVGLSTIAQAVAGGSGSAPCRLVLLSTGLLRVWGNEALQPWKASMLGVLRTAPHEVVHLEGLHIDVGLEEAISRPTVRRLLGELSTADRLSHVPSLALRAGEFWHAHFEVISESALPAACEQGRLRVQGVYLITGGFGGIGSTLASAMARACPGIRLALLSRPRTAVEPASDRGVLLAELQAQQAEVRVFEADVTDSVRMAEVATALRDWGDLRGVIHAAGVVGGGLMELGLQQQGNNLDVKVRGLLVLEQYLQFEQLDFVLLCSSLGAYTGAFGQLDNTVANLFFDTFAQARASEAAELGRKPNVQAVGWDYWLGVGMLEQLAATHRRISGRDFTLGLEPSEGVAWFWRALALGAPQFLVSAGDVTARLEATKRECGSARALFEQAQLEPQSSGPSSGNRPALVTPLLAPQDALEAVLCDLWEQALGIQPVGVRDDFRELGGQSLAALPLVGQIREILRVRLSLRDFFAAGNVASLAAHIRQHDGPDQVAHAIAEALQTARAVGVVGAGRASAQGVDV